MINWKKQRVLILAPHPDDEAFACGGLIARCKREGGEVFVMYMTVGTTKDFSRRGVSTQDERLTEVTKAVRLLNIDGHRIVFPGNDFHLRLDQMAQKDIVHEIERGRDVSLEKIEPTMVITSSLDDYNQDHRAIAQAMITATRPTPGRHKSFQRLVLFSELPGNAWTAGMQYSAPNFFVELEARDLRLKIRSVKNYRSQLKEEHGPLSVHGITTLAQMRGVQSGTRWAEAYVTRRILT